MLLLLLLLSAVSLSLALLPWLSIGILVLYLHMNLSLTPILQHHSQCTGMFAEQLGCLVVVSMKHHMECPFTILEQFHCHFAQMFRAQLQLQPLSTAVQSLRDLPRQTVVKILRLCIQWNVTHSLGHGLHPFKQGLFCLSGAGSGNLNICQMSMKRIILFFRHGTAISLGPGTLSLLDLGILFFRRLYQLRNLVRHRLRFRHSSLGLSCCGRISHRSHRLCRLEHLGNRRCRRHRLSLD